MKAKPDCIVCMFKQALNTIRRVTDDEDVHRRALVELAGVVAGYADLRVTPAALSQPAYGIVARITGVNDPFREHKRESNEAALHILPHLRPLVEDSEDSLETALKLAAAGNVIDAGIAHEYDIERDVREMMGRDFAVSALDEFRGELGPGRKLLYLGDNAGEIVFDTVLVDEVAGSGAEVVYSVKSGPIINDATMTDARQAGMTRKARVIETGGADIGVDFGNVSNEFMREFASADVILAKGHGNFETCNERTENIYFLLKAKCPMVADALGVKVGDIVFSRSPAVRGLT